MLELFTQKFYYLLKASFFTLLLAVISGVFVWYDAKRLGQKHVSWTIFTILFFPVSLLGYFGYRYKLKGARKTTRN